MSGSLTFAAFAAANRKRCEEDFGRKLGTRDAIISMAIGLAEEAGEVAGAVRAFLGISERKTPSAEKVGDEIADLVSYADLLAQAHGLTLEAALIAKFDSVSERIGSAVRLTVKETSKAEARGDVPQGPRSPLTAVRECAEAAQAGDATAARSASPLHASSEPGAGAKTRESVVSSPRNQAGLGDGKTVEHQTQLSALVPDELCDIDDLPDCLVGGVHQPHCRHAGKPVAAILIGWRLDGR